MLFLSALTEPNTGNFRMPCSELTMWCQREYQPYLVGDLWMHASTRTHSWTWFIGATHGKELNMVLEILCRLRLCHIKRFLCTPKRYTDLNSYIYCCFIPSLWIIYYLQFLSSLLFTYIWFQNGFQKSIHPIGIPRSSSMQLYYHCV